eukprot:SAG11_NODE_452_length_9380_cov_10.655533_6_plen_99_part_00
MHRSWGAIRAVQSKEAIEHALADYRARASVGPDGLAWAFPVAVQQLEEALALASQKADAKLRREVMDADAAASSEAFLRGCRTFEDKMLASNRAQVSP